MAVTVEFKLLPLAQASVKATDDGKAVRVEGYGSTFGGPPDSFGDIIAAGAYRNTIADWQRTGRFLPMLFNHSTNQVVGRWDQLAEDQRGLLSIGELTPGHSLANDVAASLKHGAVTGLSIGFRTKAYEVDRATETRTLTEIELLELSVVTMPANDFARVIAVKARGSEVPADLPQTVRECERFLRSLGFSTAQSKAMAAAIKGRGLRDEDLPDDTGNTGLRDEDGLAELAALYRRSASILIGG